MKWILLLGLFLVHGSFAEESTATQVLTIDGSQMQLQTELETRSEDSVEWQEVNVPATCHRTEYNRECRTVTPPCRTRCRFVRWGCRRVCYRPVNQCTDTPREIPYDCSRTERRPVRTSGLVVEHHVFVQVNTGIYSDVNEKLEIKAVGDKIVARQVETQQYILEIAPITSRSEISGGKKIIYHDVIVDVVTQQVLID